MLQFDVIRLCSLGEVEAKCYTNNSRLREMHDTIADILPRPIENSYKNWVDQVQALSQVSLGRN